MIVEPLWPAWVDIAAGGLGMAWALNTLARWRQGRPLHRDAPKAAMGLLLFGIALVLVGAIRWPG